MGRHRSPPRHISWYIARLLSWKLDDFAAAIQNIQCAVDYQNPIPILLHTRRVAQRESIQATKLEGRLEAARIVGVSAYHKERLLHRLSHLRRKYIRTTAKAAILMDELRQRHENVLQESLRNV